MKTCISMSGGLIESSSGCCVRGGRGGINKELSSSNGKPKQVLNLGETCEAEETYYDKGKNIYIDDKPLAAIILPPPPASDDEKQLISNYGMISVLGRRREMEDAVKVAPGAVVGEHGRSYDFFAVYDGHQHGGGAMVCNALCRERMHNQLAKDVAEKGLGKGLDYWREVMTKCFQKMDEEVRVAGGGGDGGGGGGDGELSSDYTLGFTAVVVLVGKEEVVVANCGVPRAILCRGGVPVPLSSSTLPQKPDRGTDEEKSVGAAAIINAGGDGDGEGDDEYLKKLKANACIPEVRVYERSDGDEFMVIGSNGLWDALSNEVVCEVVGKCCQFNGQRRQMMMKMKMMRRSCSDEYLGAAQAVAMLVNLAIARGSKDNISIIAVDLT